MIKPDPPISASTEADLERRLRALPPVPGPDPRFRAELRVQLLAAVERGPQTETTAPVGRLQLAGGRHGAAGPRRSGSARTPRFALPGRIASRFALPGAMHVQSPQLGRRALTALGAALAVLLVVTGTTYWLAQRALPGDALYGLKRAGETVDLSTKDGDVSRGSAYLSLSTTRIDEAAALVRRATSAAEPGTAHRHPGLSAAGPLSAHVDELVYGVLSDGDTSAITATRLLTTASVANRAQKPVTSVTTWLSDQRDKVSILVARLPETAPSTAGGAARTLARDLAAIQARVKAITVGVRCATCRFTASDRLGPVPCPTCPSPVSRPAPTRAKTTAPRSTPAPTIVTTTPAAPTAVPTTSGAVTGSATTTTSPPVSPAPTTPLPPPAPSTPTPTTPSDPGTPTPTPTSTPTPTDTPTTDTPTVPSFDPSCLPIVCTSSAGAAPS